MSNLKQNLINSLEAAVKENARTQIKNEIRSLITRNWTDQETMKEVNKVYSIVSIPTPSANPSTYKVYTPDFGIKKKSTPQPKAVVADKEEAKIIEAPDDLTVEQIEDLIKEDAIEKEFGSIEAFQKYTEDRYGINYGRKTAKNSVLNHFLERIEVGEVEDEEQDVFND